jgi:hypothetical protein
MATASFGLTKHYPKRSHPYGAHGILLALPLSVALWLLIALPFI